MANALTNIIPQILARGLLALREQAVMARLVMTDMGDEAAQKGSTIDIPLPGTFTAQDVTPAPVHSSAQDSDLGLVQVSLNNWKHVDFFLTDKEYDQVMQDRHFVPMNVSSAIRALANSIDDTIHSNYKDVYGFVGTAGTTPFSSTITDATNVRKVLNEQLAPIDDNRRIVFDPAAEANALALPALADFDKTGDQGPRIAGELGRKVGMRFFMSQNTKTHSAGTAATIVVSSTQAANSSTIGLSASTGGTLVTGDIISFAGHSQTYTVQATATVGTNTAVRVSPNLEVIVTAAAEVTKRATHVVNLGFHRDAFAFANRPLRSDQNLGTLISSATDPISGITLRLEVGRQYKQTSWDFDALWGTKTVRPELAVRLAG
jgi:hypothetical protein